METIIQNQGLQHIVEKSLMYLDKKSINSFRLVNNDFKRITESPRVLRVLKVRKLAKAIKGFLFNCYVTKGTVLSARVVINFEKFLGAIWFVNLVRFFFRTFKNKEIKFVSLNYSSD